jgi:hypothetical protein
MWYVNAQYGRALPGDHHNTYQKCKHRDLQYINRRLSTASTASNEQSYTGALHQTARGDDKKEIMSVDTADQSIVISSLLHYQSCLLQTK